MRSLRLSFVLFMGACGGSSPFAPGSAEGLAAFTCADVDRDGYTACVDDAGMPVITPNRDCNDTDAAINPFAVDICDGVDNDCDGEMDGEDTTPGGAGGNAVYSVWDGDGDGYVTVDGDGDGVVDPGVSTLMGCDPTQADQYQDLLDKAGLSEEDADLLLSRFIYVESVLGDDCNDAAADVYLDAPELCVNEGTDNDCDLDATEFTDGANWWPDGDLDGQGNSSISPILACAAPNPTDVGNGTDCNDAAADVYLGAPELCVNEGTDNDCDTVSFDEADDSTAYYLDLDNDDYGVPSGPLWACVDPGDRWSTRMDDCNDADPSVHPGALELPDGRDNDCDTVVDDDAAFTTVFIVTNPSGGFSDPEFLVYAEDEGGVKLNWIDPWSDPGFTCQEIDGVPTNTWWCEWNDWVDPATGFVQIYAAFAGGQDLCDTDVSSELFGHDGDFSIIEWDDFETFEDVDGDPVTPMSCVKQFVEMLAPPPPI